jgi:hypothetical protein
MADESVAIRGFPSKQPKDTTLYDALKKGTARFGEGMPLPAGKSDRKFKDKWTKGTPMKVTEDGFTVMVSLEPNVRYHEMKMNLDNTTPRTFVKFTIGEEAIFSFAISPTVPTYPFYPDAKVKAITYTKSSGAVKIGFSNGETFRIMSDGAITFTAAAPDGRDGFIINEGDFVEALPAQFVMIAPIEEKAAMKAVMEAGEDLLDEVAKLNKRGVGFYVFNAETATAYITPQSFTGNQDIDSKFLLTPSVDFEDLKEIDMKKEYLIFDLICENRTFTTDNYTGYDASDTTSYIARLVFPGDEAKLAPNGTKEGVSAQCGWESPKGRVIESITPAYNDAGNISQVSIEFEDGSTCTFPDAETQEFSATDKENEQLLRGTVQGLALQKGSYQEAYMKEEANRIERNTDEFSNIFDEKGKSITSAIAWKEKGVIKILVPDPNKKTGSILITILKEA